MKKSVRKPQNAGCSVIDGRYEALQNGAAVGVKYYVKNSYDKIVGGTCTEEQALSMKKRFEEEDKHNPWTKGSTRFYITKIG